MSRLDSKTKKTKPKVDPQRSAIMRAVKSCDTSPELIVRKLAHKLGFRFRLHGEDLPGSPDIVFAGRRKLIFVHGCFWHGHNCARGARIPKSNTAYWIEKIRRNKERDRKVSHLLKKDRWTSLVVWECETRELETLTRKVQTFLRKS